MKVIIVDDDRLSLEVLAKMLRDIGDLEIIGKYRDARRALETVRRDRPDVVFLDIEMPGLNGIEMAEQIRSILPNTNVVFITSYEEYAIKAFELNALDYILKPVQRNRLAKTVQRIQDENDKRSPTPASVHPVMIRCFQSLQFERSGINPNPLTVHWRTSMARELFAYLLHYRGQSVRKDMLIDFFWPETDRKKGFTQLYTTVYQIRKTLKSIGVDCQILSRNEGYLLDLNGVRLDVDEWERGVSKIASITDDTLPEHYRLIELYRGDYLADHGYLWAESERERLRSLWFRHVKQVADYLISKGEYREALALYHRIQSLHPYMEESYFMLMRLYDILGDRESVVQQYTHLKEMLRNEFDVKPRPSVQLWFNKWKANQN